MGKIVYKTADGKRVPSVTSVIKHVEGDPGGLMHWAWNLGDQGITLDDARQDAANIGKIVHACIEAELKGEEVTLGSIIEPEVRAAVEASLSAWRLWKESVGQFERVLCCEVPLVSERHRIGGTMDSLLISKGKRCLFDYKTGNGLHGKDVVQVAAYGEIWNELHPDEQVELYCLLRLPKDGTGFTWKLLTAEALEPARQAFIHARALYDLAKVVGKMVA